MIEYWIIAVLGILGIFCILCIMVYFFFRKEQKFFREQVILNACTDLFSAIRELHAAGSDECRLASAKQSLAGTVYRISLLADYKVLLRIGELQDFLNESGNGEPDPAREQEILESFVSAVCRTMDPTTALQLREANAGLRSHIRQEKP